MEAAVVRLQHDIVDYRMELRLNRTQRPAILSRPTKRSGFTSTPVPRFSGKSSWEQYRQVFEAIARSNGWDDVTAALQLLSHLDGDALNVALLVPESQRILPGFLVKSLSDHYGSPGQLAEYKRQFERAFRRPGDDPSLFAIELETLAWRVFVDIDPSIQLQMVRDRFIDGQVECALRRHLDSLGPDTPMGDIVDSCRVWESHIEVASGRQMGVVTHSPRAVCQVTEDSLSPAVLAGSETLEDIMRRLLPTPKVPPPKAATIPSDRELLIQCLLRAIRPPQPVIHERSKLTDMNIMLQNWLPVGAVTKKNISSSESISESLERCFSCGALTHTTDQCQTLDESFPFLPTGWQADHIGDKFILRPGLAGPPANRWETPTDPGRVAWISNDYELQLPVVGEDIPGPAVPNYLGTVWSLETVDQWATVVGHGSRLPCSDSDDSDDGVLSVGPMRPLVTAAPLGGGGGAQGHDDGRLQVDQLREWTVYSWTADDSCGECCAQLDDFHWMIPADDRIGGLVRTRVTGGFAGH